MKRAVSLFLFLLMIFASCHKPVPKPQAKVKNNVQVAFKATPQTFSAEGGKGIIEGVLKEISPEGKIIKETALTKSEFSLSLKSGNASQIKIDNDKKEFTIEKGIEGISFIIIARVNKDKKLSSEITLTREKGGKPQHKVKIPLEYVAEYNVGKTIGTFATSHHNDASGYFSFEENSKVCPPGYHTPSRQEAAILMPLFGPQYEIYVLFDTNRISKDRQEAIKIGKIKATYLCDYKSAKGSSICYALRFKKATSEVEQGYPAAMDNKLQCAYRYEVVGEHKDGAKESHLKITARLVGEAFSGDIESIADENFWKKNTTKDVIRIIPSSIYYHPQKHKDILGAGAFLWTSTVHEKQKGFVWTIAYIPKMAYISYNSNLFRFGIRPIEDEK